MKTLLQLARDGAREELEARLRAHVNEFGHGRGQMSEEERLLDEALTFTRLGDMDEAEHLLERRAHPKFYSEHQCRREYDQAMKEKRAREGVA